MAVVFYGLGGIGTGVLLRIKKKIEERRLGEILGKSVFFYGFDIQSDYDVEKVGTDINRCSGLELADPNSVIEEEWKKGEFKKWWIDRKSVV